MPFTLVEPKQLLEAYCTNGDRNFPTKLAIKTHSLRMRARGPFERSRLVVKRPLLRRHVFATEKFVSGQRGAVEMIPVVPS